MDDNLKSYAQSRLSRARPDADERGIEAYLASPGFLGLKKIFDKHLLKELDQFLAREPAAAPSGFQAKPAASQSLIEPAGTPLPWRPPELPARFPAAAARTAPDADIPGPAASLPSQTEDRLASMAPDPRYAAGTGGLGLAAPPAPRPAPQPPATQSALPPPDLPDIGFRLPNARAGNAYAHRLEAVDSSEAVIFDEVTIPDELSMSADPATGAVTGTPLVAGDHDIVVTYHYERQSPSRRRRAVVPVSVAPDPRTMWKNLPSDRTDPYWKEDEQCSSIRGPDLSIVAASKRGRSHAHVGSFRDDDYRIEHLADSGWYVAVVADGAGSARFSRRGAALICEEARTRILASLTDSTVDQIDQSAQAHAQAGADGLPMEQAEALRQELHTKLSRIVGNAAYWAVRAIHDEIGRRADLRGTFKDYSSTALIAVCKRYPFGTLCAAYWIGDGAIGIYSKRDGTILLGEVDSGEFSGQTRFLDNTAVDHEVLRKRTRFAIVEDMTALVLMTDGVSDAKFETEARLTRADDWDGFWEELDQAVGFAGQGDGQERRLLDWLDFWSQGNHDDRTIAIIY